MLVLLSFVLVLVATVLLVLGLLVDEGLGLIYLSIGLSALAAVLLVAAVRVSKPSTVKAKAPAPLEPEDDEHDLAPAGAPARSETPTSAPAVAAAAAAAPAAAARAPEPEVDEEPDWEPEPVAAPPSPEGAGDDWLASGEDWGRQDDRDTDGDQSGHRAEDGGDFPIADYDDLAEDEVLGLLPQLYSDELDVVEARERAGHGRAPVLAALARLRSTGTDADRTAAAEPEAPAQPEGPAEPDGADAGDEGDWEPSPALPITGYDDLAVSEVIGALGDLDEDELAEVREHEAATKNRRTVLTAIDRRLGAPGSG